MNAQYNFYAPSLLLQPFVKKYIIIESGHDMVNKVLPQTSLVMVFRFKGLINQLVNDHKLTLPSLVISGLQRSARLINYTENSGTVLVLFKEARAASFFKEPLHELFESSISLNDLFNKQSAPGVEEELALAENNSDRIQVVERFLLSRLMHHKPDPLIEEALQKIYVSNGLVRIKDLAGSLYISQDAFEKRFRRVVGTSPKQYSTIIRMNAIISKGLQSQTFTDMAFDAGYFDQSHFNKDFRIFTGQSPTDYFKSSSF
jgi:AraC-like DNA-binding protein